MKESKDKITKASQERSSSLGLSVTPFSRQRVTTRSTSAAAAAAAAAASERPRTRAKPLEKDRERAKAGARPPERDRAKPGSKPLVERGRPAARPHPVRKTVIPGEKGL